MTHASDIGSGAGRGEPDPDEPAQDPGDAALARYLEDERPVPHPSLRSRIRAAIFAEGNIRSRPPQLRRLVAIYGGSGLALLAFAVVGLLGAGPLAP